MLVSFDKKFRVDSPKRPCASNVIGMMGNDPYLCRLCCSASEFACPGVMELTWIPAEAASEKAEVTMMSM